jgi:hypothetical protein
MTLAGAFAAVALTFLGAVSAVSADPPSGSTLNRPQEPVVVQQAVPDQTGYAAIGSVNVQLPNRLLGIAPNDLVAFRWEGGWTQVPVQVDERDVMDLNRIYTTSRPTCSDPCYSNPPDGGAIHPEFTDPNTFVGPDSDPTLDPNDEVALMASDAGGQVTTPYAPAGVDPASAVEVKVSDPLDGGVGYAYLFKSTSGLDPAAGRDYVHYDFNLTNGPYKTGAYNPTGAAAGGGMNSGPRPETSFVQTDNYKRGFTDRWYDNELRVFRGGATGVDILDRHDDQFDAIDASCVRDQQTFSVGEGAFIVNKDGPVRAIRDFVGANSGPDVQREHIFYNDLEVINTFLRVHPIPGVVDFFDYSAAGRGLIYKNGVMTPNGIVSGTPASGVTIDGQPDAVTGAGTSMLPGFESVDGPQGSLTMTQRLLTNNPDPGYHLVYRDGNTSGQHLCTGDDNELYGASGPQLNSAINNTDEANRNTYGGGQYSNLFYQRDIYYGAPGEADGPQKLADTQSPLQLSLQGVELSEAPSYPRPKGATPLRVPLVPASKACTGPNSTHGAPLAFGSCAPPQQASSRLTVGTPDANGQAARSQGSVLYRVVPGDVQVDASVTDVRQQGSLADYAGELGVEQTVQVTDRMNGPAQDEPATVQPAPFRFAVPCAATADQTVGGTCSLSSTFNALVPGVVQEGNRAIWELGPIRLFDGDNAVFETQGLFVP